MRGRDASAEEEQIRQAITRLERLSRKMYADFQRLRRWVGSDDVLQRASIRLTRAMAGSGRRHRHLSENGEAPLAGCPAGAARTAEV
jgi:uncharacterized protein YifN (PemK superfamily)